MHYFPLKRQKQPPPFRESNIPVDRLVVALVRDNFRCQVVGSTAQRPSLVGNALGKAKVGDLEVAMAVEQQVLGFEISVNNVALV